MVCSRLARGSELFCACEFGGGAGRLGDDCFANRIQNAPVGISGFRRGEICFGQAALDLGRQARRNIFCRVWILHIKVARFTHPAWTPVIYMFEGPR